MAGKAAARAKGQTPRKPKKLKFTIDCSHPVEDGIMDAGVFEKYLRDHVKVGGRAGALGDSVQIVREKSKIQVTAEPPFAKRYLKYLTKKYLKKNQLRDWLRVIANSKNTYELKYFKIHEDEEEDEDEADD
eukprot:TRINITY_DN14734_c0_g1_i1.p1 TRINITY_DN14734_c0_g1~~TRINITY_DN14734_c0_g1_i1.p1  ORF type:complete len:145 (+),score=32.39 TRINITY_DN14734_c0_g1_i1:44-436(+)